LKDTGLKNLLVIAYLFPPLGGSGALRPLKLAKYLPHYGWRPIVLSAKNSDWYYAYDPELLTELPSDAVIKRSFMFKASWFYRVLNPYKNPRLDRFLRHVFFHPDEQIGWLPFGWHAGRRLIQRHNIQAIYSTSGPLTNHLIARRLKQRFGIYWQAEFRDEWFEAPNLSLPTRFHRRLHYSLEKKIVTRADKIVAMAPEFCNYLAKHKVDKDKFCTLTAGYDPEDLQQYVLPQGAGPRQGLFRIAFIGLFYETFRPTALLRAVTELIDQGVIGAHEVRIQFVGANSPEDIPWPDKYRVCKFTGFLKRREALGHLAISDALLLLLSKERGPGVIPSKVFEYIGFGKPILALVPPHSTVAGIITAEQAGIVADFEDIAAIKNAFLQLITRWRRGDLATPSRRNDIAQYDYRCITQRFAALLDEGCRRISKTI